MGLSIELRIVGRRDPELTVKRFLINGSNLNLFAKRMKHTSVTIVVFEMIINLPHLTTAGGLKLLQADKGSNIDS